MSRGSIIAGKAVILLSVQDKVDATLAKVRTKLRRFSNTLGSVGGSSIRGGFLGGLLSSAITRDYMLFEKQILKLQGKLGLFDRTAEQTRRTMMDLERTILQLGKTTSFTAQEVAEAATELAQAGFKAQEIKDTLEPLLDLARGTDRNLGPTAEFLSNTIRTFNLETKDATMVADMFVKATRLGTIELEDLQEAMKYASGTAFNLKQDLATLLGFLVQASESGLRGSLGGTSFNTMMNNLAKYGDRYQTFVGKTLAKKPDGELDLVKTMVDLSAAMRGMSGVDKVAKLAELFNLRGQRFASATQEMEKVVEKIVEISNAMDEASQSRELLESGLWGSWIRASSAVETFSKTLGRLQSTFLGKILDTVPLLVDMLDRLAMANQNVVVGILAAPFAIAAMGVAFIGLQKILLGVAGAAGMLRSALGAIGNVVGPGIGKQLAAIASIGRAKSTGGLGMIGRGAMGVGSGLKAGRAAFVAERVRKGLDLSASRGYKKIAAKHFAEAAYQRRLAKAITMRAGGANAPAAAQAAMRARIAQAKGVSAMGQSARLAGMAKQGSATVRGLAAMGNAGKGILSLGKGIAALTQGFMKFTAATARFAFSKAGITTILQLLLIFGDRIPGIRDAFESLGKGFGVFFAELKKIGSLGAGPFQRIMDGISMYKAGNTQGGIAAFIEGIGGLVGVISGQLRAAWWGFAEQVGWVYDLFKKIVGSVWEIAKVFGRISANVLGTFVGDVRRMAENLTTGSGGGFAEGAKAFVIGIGEAFGFFGTLILDLKQALYDWLHAFQMTIVDIMPGLTPEQRALNKVYDGQALERRSEVNLAKAQIEHDLQLFRDAINEAFSSSTEGFRAAKEAAQADAIRASQMSELNPAVKNDPGNLSVSSRYDSPEGSKAIEELKDSLKVAANFIGSVAQAQGNMLKAFAPKRDLEKEQLEEQQETNEHLATLVSRGGRFVFTS